MDDPLEDSKGVDQEELKEKMSESAFGGDNDLNDDSAVAEAFSDLIGELSKDERIQMFSDLTATEIRHLSVLQTAGDSITQEFAKRYMKQKVSYRRRGRKELIEVSDAIGNKQDMEEGGGKLDRLRSII